MREAPGGRKKGKHANIELREENSSLGTWLQSCLKLSWPHVLSAWGQLTYICCPSFIIDNILFTLRNIAVWTMNYIVTLPETHVLHGASNKVGKDLQACMCMCVRVPRLLGIVLRPGTDETDATPLPGTAQHRLRLQLTNNSQEPLP